jgi:hypothetical protein|tara:strand:- start:10660 stop:10863 length:204 start_codon:yes stop_codon:yes gene_type:complete
LSNLFLIANLFVYKTTAIKRVSLKLLEQARGGALKLFELILSFACKTVSDQDVNKGKKSTPQIAPLI